MSTGPLSGLSVVVTRPRHQAEALVAALEAEGATAVSVPVIEVHDPDDGGAALRAGLSALRSGDWLVITSPNGAERVGAAVAETALADGVSVASIGPGTGRVAVAAGLSVDLIPERSIAEGLLEVFPDPPSGGVVVLARALVAREVLPDGLAARGWIVDDIAAYRTDAVPVDDAGRASCRESDAVVFTSSSTVSRLVEAVGLDNLPPLVVSIGPATSATALDLGISVKVEASAHTIAGIVDALIDHVSST